MPRTRKCPGSLLVLFAGSSWSFLRSTGARRARARAKKKALSPLRHGIPPTASCSPSSSWWNILATGHCDSLSIEETHHTCRRNSVAKGLFLSPFARSHCNDCLRREHRNSETAAAARCFGRLRGTSRLGRCCTRA